MNAIRLDFHAALSNPNDPSEVTLVADVVGVGRTNRLATGQIITWTAEFLKAKAHTFIGKPVNIDLDEDGEPTGHSRRVVGAITHAFFDERKQVVTVHAAIWPHYAPSTVGRIKELAAEARIQVSMEFIPDGDLLANDDGSESPVDGEFSGLGIVRVGADPRNKVILVAALAEDEGSVEVRMNLDQITEAVARKLGYRQPDVDGATQSVTDDTAVDSEEVVASTDKDAPTTTQEDATLATELTEEQRASLREELLAELKPQLDELATVKAENETLKAKEAAREAADAKKELVATRMAELEDISPAGDGKERREALCAALDDDAFANYKADLAAAAEVKGGISSDAKRHEDTEGEAKPLVDADGAQALVKESIAAAGLAATSEGK